MALAAGLATNREVPILGLMGDGAASAAGMDFESGVRWNIPAVLSRLPKDWQEGITVCQKK